MKIALLYRGLAAVIIGMATPTGIALAAGEGGHGHGAGHHGEIGQPGDAAAANRTIEVVMHDNYYEPESISVKEGETVRFVIHNRGELVHEFNIGTSEMHMAHHMEMQMMVDHGVLEADRINWDAAKAMQDSMGHGMHEEPNSALLAPGDSAEIVWTFPKHAELEFACNVPGHYDAGMTGDIKLTH